MSEAEENGRGRHFKMFFAGRSANLTFVLNRLSEITHDANAQISGRQCLPYVEITQTV
ncbi:MAG: hypothetical protein HW390_843 [Candidatus Brocadiaceae bacterium]|nr:hypothetical protein [Candidatus Brocadiaceae bacterium]